MVLHERRKGEQPACHVSREFAMRCGQCVMLSCVQRLGYIFWSSSSSLSEIANLDTPDFVCRMFAYYAR